MFYCKRSFPSSAIVYVLLVLAASSYVGCLPPPGGGAGRGERKKMLTPDASDASWERMGIAGSGNGSVGAMAIDPRPALPFILQDTTILVDNETADFVLLRLPMAEYDYLLLAAKGYEAWLPGWLNAWPQSGRAGMAIDLSTGRASHRCDFRVSGGPQQASFRLVLLWDEAASSRASIITQFLLSLSSIQCQKING